VRLNRLFVLIAVLALAFVPLTSSAQIGLEDFVYSPPGIPIAGLNGGSGWATAWGKSSPFEKAFKVRNGGLTFPGLLTTGNAAFADYEGSTWAFNNRFLAAAYGAAGTSTWLEYLIRPEVGYGQWGTIGLGVGGFAANGSVQVGLNNDQTGHYLMIQHWQGGPHLYRVPFNYQVNTTYFIRARYDFLPGNLVNVYAEVWPTNMGPAAWVSASNLYWAGTSYQLQLYSSGNYSYDGFCVGQQCQPPVPEAGTMVALGSFLSMGGLFLRRRFARS